MSQFIEMFGDAEKKPFVDVCINKGEYGSNSPADDYDGNIRYVRITDITEEGNLNSLVVSPRKVEEKYMLLRDDLLFARTGNTVGKTYLHRSGRMIFAGYLIRYRLNNKLMLPQFAFAYTHTNQYYDWVEKIKKVGAQPNISAAQYDSMPIPVPSMAKQIEFVSIAKQADKSKFGDFKSQFIEMFGNTSKEMLGKFIQVIRGVSYKPSDVKTADDPDTAVILRSNNINDANLNTDEVVYINKNRVSGDQYLRVNDIVVCASNGSKALVGKAAINKTLTNQYAHGAFCLLVRPNDNINPVYLNTFFQTSLYKKQIDELAAGSNILNIKQEYLTNMILPLPIIEEQNKFAIIAEQADKSKSYVWTALKNLESMLGYYIRQVA